MEKEQKYVAKEDKFLLEKIADTSKHGLKYRYMLLSRMQMDCDYYLGNGHRSSKYLWALDETQHITAMRMLWDAFPADMKPEWLTKEQLEDYAKQMNVA